MRTIAHMSDLHFGRHDPAIAEDLLTSLEASHPDLVVISGDVTQRARHSEFMAAKRFLDRIHQPKLIVPGNHDVPLYNFLGRMLTPFAKFHHYVAVAGLADGFFCDDEIAVLALNTARRLSGKSGRISLKQIIEIRRAFTQASRSFKVLVTHHPLGFPGSEPARTLAGRSSQALEEIAQAGIHLLLSGHYHRPVSGYLEPEMTGRNSVLIFHAGTAISNLHQGWQRQQL